jgi:hypothetical protein
MIMMLPFLLVTVAVWFGMRGQRGACCMFWMLTLLVFGVWCHFHMTDALNLSL